MSQLTLSLLGTFQAYLDGTHLTGFESNKVRALLVFLAIEGGRPHSRVQLAGLFWPEWPESAARAHLRHALANLRQLLGDKTADTPFLLVTRNTLQFNSASDYQVDILQISQGLAPLQSPRVQYEELPQIQKVVALYHSYFLEGFFLEGCATFEEWVLLIRERLQRQVLEALRLLTDHFTTVGDYRQAITYGQQRVDFEPWLEEAHVAVMRLFMLSGQRGAALAQYERCRHVLHEELGVEPTSDTEALAQQIRAVPDGMLPKDRAIEGWTSEIRGIQHARLKLPDIFAHEPLTLSAPKHTLPAQLTPLIGRVQEINAIQGLFHKEGARLVTLTGTGGIGKTRVAVQVAQELRHDFPDGVYLVELAPVCEPDLVISAIAQVLKIQDSGSRPLRERVLAQLQDVNALLLLDNFEHVVVAAPLVSQLLVNCPQLKVLVTSRERLYLRGEFEYRVPPLAIPTNAGQIKTDELATFSAVELFRQRAVAAKPDFVLDVSNTPIVAELCMRLDGVPLALELAAARLKLFSPQALLQRLTVTGSTSSLHFLAGGLRDAPARHQSLWHTLAWSYDLLRRDEQMLFQNLAVFSSGCTFDAIAAICTDTEDRELRDLVNSLVDKSLLCQEQTVDGEPRFRMLETIREFGLEQLQANAQLETLQRRHAHYFLDLAKAADSHMQAPDQLLWLERMDAEHNNLRAALLWATTHAPDLGLRLGAALPRFWERRGYEQEGYRYLLALIDQCQGREVHAPIEDILFFAGRFAIRIDDLSTAYSYFEQSAEACHKTGNRHRLSYNLALMAHLSHEMGHYVAGDVLYTQALELAYEIEDTFGLALLLSHHGRMLAERGLVSEECEVAEQGLALLREIGDRWGTAIALHNLGVVRWLQDDYTSAQSLFEEGLHLGKQLGNLRSRAASLYELGFIQAEQGELTTARTYLHEATHIYYQIGSASQLAEALDAWAFLAAAEHQYKRALHLTSAAARLRTSKNFVRAPRLQAKIDQVAQAARQALTEDVSALAWAAGERMMLGEAVTYAMAG